MQTTPPTTGDLYLDALNKATATHLTPATTTVAFTSGAGACQVRIFESNDRRAK